MAETIDSLFIEANIKKLDDDIEDNKEYEHLIFKPYDFSIINIVNKVKKYLNLQGEAA